MTQDSAHAHVHVLAGLDADACGCSKLTAHGGVTIGLRLADVCWLHVQDCATEEDVASWPPPLRRLVEAGVAPRGNTPAGA